MGVFLVGGFVGDGAAGGAVFAFRRCLLAFGGRRCVSAAADRKAWLI